jgi:hypothetical protein
VFFLSFFPNPYDNACLCVNKPQSKHTNPRTGGGPVLDACLLLAALLLCFGFFVCLCVCGCFLSVFSFPPSRFVYIYNILVAQAFPLHVSFFSLCVCVCCMRVYTLERSTFLHDYMTTFGCWSQKKLLFPLSFFRAFVCVCMYIAGVYMCICMFSP